MRPTASVGLGRDPIRRDMDTDQVVLVSIAISPSPGVLMRLP
jgi:hypothetical protein